MHIELLIVIILYKKNLSVWVKFSLFGYVQFARKFKSSWGPLKMVGIVRIQNNAADRSLHEFFLTENWV